MSEEDRLSSAQPVLLTHLLLGGEELSSVQSILSLHVTIEIVVCRCDVKSTGFIQANSILVGCLDFQHDPARSHSLVIQFANDKLQHLPAITLPAILRANEKAVDANRLVLVDQTQAAKRLSGERGEIDLLASILIGFVHQRTRVLFLTYIRLKDRD